jgi:hypothetical protein
MGGLYLYLQGELALFEVRAIDETSVKSLNSGTRRKKKVNVGESLKFKHH